MSELELVLFQVIILASGLVGSFFFGRVSAPAPQARSAFRRVWSIYLAWGRLQSSIQSRGEFLAAIAAGNADAVPMNHVTAALAHLHSQVDEQLQTANDAVEDWRDLAPSEVATIEEQLKQRESEQQ